MKFNVDIDEKVSNCTLPGEMITGISKVEKLIEDDVKKRYWIEKLERLPDGDYVCDSSAEYEIVEVKVKIKERKKK